MKNSRLATAALAMLSAAGGASAATLEEELNAIKARLSALEQQVREQGKVIDRKDREIAALKNAEAPAAGGWFQAMQIGGVVELEASHHSPYTGSNTSDVVVATVEIGIAAQINDWVASEITLLYEEDETDLEVDVATITIAPPHGDWFIAAGQQYLPFGTYDSNLVSDPLTLEIGETRETAVLAGLASDDYSAGLYVFNGDNEKDADDLIDNVGAFAAYARELANGSVAVNLSYVNDIGDSDTLQSAINDNLGNNDVNDHVAGWSVDAMFSGGPFVFIGEYTAAGDRFETAELPFRGKGAQPAAWNLEAGYNFRLAGKDATVAIAYQGTDEAVALELPEQRVLAAISVAIMEATTLSFEWARDTDYGRSDGGTGETANTATAQLAVEF